MGEMEWLEEAWELREEVIYRNFFGADSGGIYPLDQEVFEPFGQENLDSRWLTHGVLKFPPNEKRGTWLYVTSGLSNAWSDAEPNPEGWSGVGCELVFETAEDLDWALFEVRRFLAFQILLGWGYYEGKGPMAIGDRLPNRSPIDRGRSELTWYLIAPPSGYPSGFQLPTGRVEFLHFVGVTESEAAFARANGYEALLEKLKPTGYPTTVPGRSAVI